MKKVIYTLLFLILFIPIIIFGKEKEMNMYLFYGNGCPHCAALEKYLDTYLDKHKNIKLYTYEVWYNEENAKLYQEIHNLLDDDSNGIPYLLIGNNAIVGFDEEYTPELINNTVNYYSKVNYKDGVGIYLGVVKDNGSEWNKDIKYEEGLEELSLPDKLKKIVNESPLIISAIAIGFVDGINPCAMWILLFLISMLLGMKNKKRKLTLGIVFLVSSALVYFLFLISWLNLATFLNKIIYIRIAIALVSVVVGTYSIIRYFNSRNVDGCEVVNSNKRKKIINSIKKIVKEKSFGLAILGIIILAASVNIIELMCSLGLPVVFTQILVLNNVSTFEKIIYSIIYVIFFLIDDIIIFIIAMKTMEIKTISNKFGKYAHLIGGIIMVIIGILMVYKPEWLMFNF